MKFMLYSYMCGKYIEEERAEVQNPCGMNMAIQIACCDDEEIILKKYKKLFLKYIIQYETELHVDYYQKGSLLLEACSKDKNAYDIILLDMEMPGMSGLETARALRKAGCGARLIFVTAYLQYMQESFEVETFRYLSKPVSESKFFAAIKDAVHQINRNQWRTIVLKVENDDLREDRVFYLDEIIYFEKEKGTRTARLYSMDGCYVIRMDIDELEKELEGQAFIRCHRAYLINVLCIRAFRDRELRMINGAVVPVSRRREIDVKKMHMRYEIHGGDGI